MKLLRIIIAVTFVIFVVSCTRNPPATDSSELTVNANESKPGAGNPKANATVLFDLKRVKSSLVEFNRTLAWNGLENTRINEAETELRLWVAFGIDKIDVIRLHWSENKWNGKLSTVTDKTPASIKTTLAISTRKLGEPKGGFRDLLYNLETLGIRFPLDFEFETHPSVPILDEGLLILEIKNSEYYSVVGYRRFDESEDGKRLLTVCRTIAERFELDLECMRKDAKEED